MRKKLMLVDGNSIINRGFYALPVLTNQEGEFTNAVYGFLNIFFKLYDQETPDYVGVAFDLPKPTFRHQKYASYKGTRKIMPAELRPQLPMLKNLLNKMNIPIFELESYEADDILGSLAIQSSRQGFDTVIISGDRDLLQIASHDVKIRIPKTKSGKTEVEDYRQADVEKIFGVTPTEYIDVKALMGDSSDNIPGVPGIGEKTALKIIQQYHSLENAILHASEIKPTKAAENLQQFQDQALLSKELATIVTHAPLTLDVQSAETKNIYTPEALAEIRRLEFKTHIARFAQHMDPLPSPSASTNYEALTEEACAIQNIHAFDAHQPVACQLIFLENVCQGAAFCQTVGKAFFISSNQHWFFSLIQLFFQNQLFIISYDIKNAMAYLQQNQLSCHFHFDVMLAGYILDSAKGSYRTGELSQDYLGESCQDEEDLLGKGRHKISVTDLTQKQLTHYACQNANMVLRLYPVMTQMLQKNGQQTLYDQLELPLVEVLRDMEAYGIQVDVDVLQIYGQNIDAKLQIIREEIYQLAGSEFNLNSPLQLGKILFEQLGLEGGKKNKQGYSTAAEILEKIKDQHPIIPKILEYRTYSKLKSTYVDGLLHVIDSKTHKIHSTFHQTIASTGRLSSVEPNLQNIPIRLELGRLLRKAFIPSDQNYVFLDGDYSQIELRVLAAVSGDETLIRAFQENQDIHRLTASQVFGVPYEAVTPLQRSNAKAVNFGIVYGISAFSLSQDLGITKKEADLYIEGYFKKYPGVKAYLERAIAEAKEKGYAKTLLNRRRNIPELFSSNYNLRSFGERVSMNMPIQGTAADIIKLAMIRVHKRLKENHMKSRLILQVHDELLLEAHRSELEEVQKILKEEMNSAMPLAVPMQTDIHIGETWYDAK